MRAVVQRVSKASVRVDGQVVGAIDRGLLVLLGVGRADDTTAADYLVEKILGLRVFPDENGKMNRNVRQVDGALLVISQFTLYGDCHKGRRPNFTMACPPEKAEPIYEIFINELRQLGLTVESGVFGAMMNVQSVNEGPVTFILET